MDSKPDTIKITAMQREEILATYADLFVTVRGSSVVSGDQAMKKAKEVSALVDELTRFGIPAENIHLQGVNVTTASVPILKSSSATYRLRVRCEKLDQFAELLDIVGAQKNASLERIAWKYADEEARTRGLEIALVQAKVKAENVAAALGVKLLGVYDFLENTFDEEAPVMFQPQMRTVGSVAPAAPSLDMEIQHSKTVQVNVEIWYRVSSFE